jgi:uncharacterized DUF497 family protein
LPSEIAGPDLTGQFPGAQKLFLGVHKLPKRVTYRTLKDRGLAFEVFEGVTLDRVDDRRDYGETRVITVGHLRGRLVIVVWTQRGDARQVISMRKANDREKAHWERYWQRSDEG